MLRIDIDDKTIQDLVTKINYKVENELYESLRELHTDYFLLNGYITFYNYNPSNYNVNILDFIEKLPIQEGECEYKWIIEGSDERPNGEHTTIGNFPTELPKGIEFNDVDTWDFNKKVDE